MRVRRLADDGDMRFGNQQADFLVDSREAVAQIVSTRLRLWRGEWLLDVEEGTPWIGAVLGYGTEPLIEPAIRARIAGTPGVIEIPRLSVVVDRAERTASIDCTITTAFGETTVQGVL